MIHKNIEMILLFVVIGLVGILYSLLPKKVIELQYEALAKKKKWYLIFFFPNVLKGIEDKQKWMRQAKMDYLKYGICLIFGSLLAILMLLLF